MSASKTPSFVAPSSFSTLAMQTVSALTFTNIPV
jgi:hypothetical protein